MSDDVFYCLSNIMNVDQAEIAKIVHSYLERDIGCEYDRMNCPAPPIYIGPVKVKTLKERLEEIKMKKATSGQNIKNVKDISFSFLSFPIERNSTLTIVATTNDDIFEIVFEGEHLIQSCKASGMFDSLEKNRKIMELEEELGKWKKEAADCLRIRDEVRREKNKEINELKQKLQQVENDKKRLIYKIAELEELQTPTIENFADEKPSTRADILDQAKKCVCGQREQDYGTPESNFQLIADLWNDYLKKERLGRSKTVVDAVDVSMMMALMKIARIRNGGGSGDSFVDLAGYAACGGEIWHGQKVKDQN